MSVFRYISSAGELVLDMAQGYLIEKPNGIDTVQVSVSQAQGINQVGSTIQSKTVQPRPVTITGMIIGEDQADKKQRLVSLVRPDLPGRLYYGEYYIEVIVTSTPAVSALKVYADFQFSLLAAYPYWRKDDSVKAMLSGIQPLFSFPWNMSRPYKFGKLMETAFLNVPNRGQVPVPFKATFAASGNVDNPQITDAMTGKFVLINKSLVSGERLVLEITHERTYLTSSVDGDCRGALSLSSDLFRLEVGDNVLKPEAAAGLENMQVSIDFATEIVGITL